MLGHIVHQLAPTGRMAIFLQPNQDSLSNMSTPKNLESTLRALFGDALPLPTNSINESGLQSIAKIIRAQKRYWTAFQFDIQLPNENVLVPPWMTDTKVLKFNPELKELPHYK